MLHLQDDSPADPTKTHVAAAHKHDSPLISCRYDPSGRYVFFGAEDSRVWRWDVAANAKSEHAAHGSWVRGLAFLADAQVLLTGGYDGRLVWWPVEGDSPPPLRAVEAHHGWVRAVAVNGDQSLVATVGNDTLVKLWSSDDGRLVRELAAHERPVYHAAFHPDGRQLATGDLMGNLFHWDVETGELVRKWNLKELHKYDPTFKADIGGFRDMRFSGDGRLLACAGITNVSNAFAGVGNPLVVMWDWEAGQQKIAHVSKGKLRGVAWGVALHPQPFVIGVCGGSGGYLLFWKADQAEEFHQLKLPNTARDLDLCPDNLHLAVAHHDGNVRICRMAEKVKG